MKTKGTLFGIPELRVTPGGKAVCHLYVRDDGDNTARQFEAWNEFAEAIARADLENFQEVAAAGVPKTRKWEDREGHTRTATYYGLKQLAFYDKDGKPVLLKEERRG